MDKLVVGDKVVFKDGSTKKVFEIVGIIGAEQAFPEYWLAPLDSDKEAVLVVDGHYLKKIEGNEKLIRILYG